MPLTPEDPSQDVQKLQERIETLRRLVDESEREQQELRQRLMGCERSLDTTQRQLQDAQYTISKMLRSSSWRMTAPYRWLRDFSKHPVRTLARTGLLYRAVTSLLILPAYLAYNGNHHGFHRSWRRDSGFMTSMVVVQDRIQESLESKPPLYRQLASVGFSLAFRIHQAGRVSLAVRNGIREIRRHGFRGLRQWARESFPGRAKNLRPITTGQHMLGVLPHAQRILVSDSRIPRADRSAGELATVGLLRDLCAFGYEVVFLPLDMAPDPEPAAILRSMGTTVITRESGFSTPLDYVRKEGGLFGAFYLIRVEVAEALVDACRQASPRSRVIYSAPDLYYLREMRAAELADDEMARQRAKRTRHREISSMRRCDHVIVVSPVEADLLRQELGGTPVSVFSALYAPVRSNVRPWSERKDVFFLGGFGHRPNVDAVIWFAERVWPLVQEKLPSVTLHIIGAEAPDDILRLGERRGITVAGYVADLTPVLESMRLSVAPLTYGAGIKGKVAVALGAGIPCVCTTIAAEGMGIEDRVHALIADAPQAFADAVAELYLDENLWAKISRSGFDLVEQRFSEKSNRMQLLQTLDAARILPLEIYKTYLDKSVLHESLNASGPRAEAVSLVAVPSFTSTRESERRALLIAAQSTRYPIEVVASPDSRWSEISHKPSSELTGQTLEPVEANAFRAAKFNELLDRASGRYILLLAEHVVPMPGWLERLTAILDDNPDVAIVGAKVLNIDGTIREAGEGIVADGTTVLHAALGSSVGDKRAAWRDDPWFNVLRDVDAIEPGAVLVRKSLFDEVRGLDAGFRTVTFAVRDLCAAARARAQRVVYEPRSEVLFEGDTRSMIHGGSARSQDVLWQEDLLRFREKWRELLERSHLPPGSPAHMVASHAERLAPLAARQRRAGGHLNVLYFSPFPSHPASHGNQATIQQFAKRIQRMGHKVHFALLQSGMFTPEDERNMRAAWDSFDLLPNARPLYATGNDIPFDDWYEEGLGERVRELCARYEIDVVFCSYVFQSKLLEYVPAHTPPRQNTCRPDRTRAVRLVH